MLLKLENLANSILFFLFSKNNNKNNKNIFLFEDLPIFPN